MGKNNGSVGLVSFQFRSILAFEVCGHLGWLRCPFLLGIPFGHVFEQVLIVWDLSPADWLAFWVVGFWATKEPRQGPRHDWRGTGNLGSVPSGLLRCSAAGFISSGAR